MADFYVKKDNTSPKLQVTLERPSGTAVDITGATVRFHMRSSMGETKVDAAATIEDAANGVVSYSWDGADTDTVGSFEGEFEVIYSDSTIETFPNTKFISIRILDKIA